MMSESKGEVYFQTQGYFSNECGRCSLNNLLGHHYFTTNNMVDICNRISNDFINPHKHLLGGDYDVNILILALHDNGYECKWMDNRKPSQVCGQQDAHQNRIVGYLINRELKKGIFTTLFQFSGRHWLSVRYFNQHLYILDSKKQKYEPLCGKIEDFLSIEMERGSYVIEVKKL